MPPKAVVLLPAIISRRGDTSIRKLCACQDPGAPGALGTLLEPPDSPDRNLLGTC